MNVSDKVSSIFRQYYTELNRFVMHKMGQHSDADDIVQDAFQNILNVDNIESIDNPRAYLYQSARNIALNRIRNKNNHDKYVSTYSGDDIGTPSAERELIAKVDLEKVQTCLAKLPERDRKTFYLNRVEGLSYKQISQELNITVSTVEKRMIKVLNHIRRALDESRL